MEREIITLYNLHPEEYEHPQDKKALDILEGTPGIETLARKVLELGAEPFFRTLHTGSDIQVTKKGMPDIYETFENVCKTLNLRSVPDLYLQQGHNINALAVGTEKPMVVFNDFTINNLTHDELVYVMGHEIGHIKSKHVLYKFIANNLLPYIGEVLGKATLGISGFLTKPIQYALMDWSRKSEYTADRAGLLACQNINSAITAMMKMAGAPHSYYDKLDPELFLEQARNFQGLNEDAYKFIKIYLILHATHPWLVLRCQELDRWIKSGAYENLLEKHSKEDKPGDMQYCSNCNKAVKTGAAFCIHCGTKI